MAKEDRKLEQILSTLATKDDLREEEERTRRHISVLAEGLEDQLRVIAEGQRAFIERMERRR